MDLKPAAVTPGLASAAMDSPALSRAVMLAAWVGDGRKTTDSGILSPAAAEQACEDLGIERPDTGKELRSAQDVPDLMIDWNVACLAGLIKLRDVFDPPVWRRVAVPGSMNLDDLHWVIQDAMGWENDHMHAFYTGRRELPGATALRDVHPRSGSSFHYLYDFGDAWTHDIGSEGFFHNDKRATLPTCLDASGACPPEDCGGLYGYYRLKEALANPDDDEHDDRLDWMGLESGAAFDPSVFSLEDANARLAHALPDEVSSH